MNYFKHIGFGVCAAVFLISCAADKAKTDQEALKGFPGDYSNLESVKGEGGEEIRRWITSKNIKGKYPKLIVDPISFYPEPQEIPQTC